VLKIAGAIPANELKGDFGTDDAIERAGGGLVFAHPSKLDGSFSARRRRERYGRSLPDVTRQ